MTDGSIYERELKKILEDLSWTVFRVAGSFKCDLIAIKPNYNIIIEVKSTKNDRFYTKSDTEQFDYLSSLAEKGFNVYYYIRWKGKKNKWSSFKLPIKRSGAYPFFDYMEETKT